MFEGKVYVMSPMGEPHILGMYKTGPALREVFGDRGVKGFHVAVQIPFAPGLTDKTPDFFVLRGELTATPAASNVVLVVEVSHSSLSDDRGFKLRYYAEQGYADYWIVNLLDRVLEIYRDPRQQADGTWTYGTKLTLDPAADARPLAKPDAAVRVADLLP